MTMEYDGPYDGCRVLCENCVHWKAVHGYGELIRVGKCALLPAEVRICRANNVCRWFEKRITHPNHRPFDYDEYFEWLMADYYRPYAIDRSKPPVARVRGIDGKMHDIPATRDSPWCRVSPPKCSFIIGHSLFTVDYWKYRDHSFIDGDYVYYAEYQYKKSRNTLRWTVLYNGKIRIDEAVRWEES